MKWLAEKCVLAYGWRRALLLFVAGGLAALSMPPLFILPTLFVALPIWIWCLDGAETSAGWRRVIGPAFTIGFSFGLGYFTVSLHWIGAAFLVEGGAMLALMPLAVLALGAFMALFWGIASGVAHLFWSAAPTRLLVLATCLSLAEFARGHLLTGFPFNLLGYALTANEIMMQASAYIGVYGLTFVVIVLASSLALIWPGDEKPLTARLAPFFGSMGVVVLLLGFGQWRLNETAITMRADMRVRLVQPAIDQSIKWQADSADFVLDRMITLSETQTGPANAGLTGVTHLIWPEAALPFYLSDFPQSLSRIARMLPPGTTLLTGAPRRDHIGRIQSGRNVPGVDIAYNSILAINAEGEIVSTYDKTHLVPVGEFLPFANLLSQIGLHQFVPGLSGWTHGDQRRLQSPPQTPAFLPLICYEAIFSGDLGPVGQDAQFMLNVTNDGWFDGSIGPAQHFHHARVRAVEHGLPLVRVANSGITAIVDPLGRVVQALPIQQMGVFDNQVPHRLPPTFFSKFTHWPFLIMLLISGVIAMFTRRAP